jgi:hypothetical protein
LTKKTVGFDIGAVAAMLTVGKIGSADLCSCRFARENRHCKLFDGHGLDTGLFRPSKKIFQRVG